MARFDWHADPITLETVIDAGYRNTQNVRRFFHAACGEGFAFDRAFMAWMKASVGTTAKPTLGKLEPSTIRLASLLARLICSPCTPESPSSGPTVFPVLRSMSATGY